MLDVRGHMCDHTSVWELSLFLPMWSTHVYKSLRCSSFSRHRPAPLLLLGQITPVVTTLLQWKSSIWNPEGTTAPEATEKSIPACSLSSAGSNQCFHRACREQCHDRFNSKYPILHVLKELRAAGVVIPSSLPSAVWRQMGRAGSTSCPGLSSVSASGLVSVCCTLCVSTHRFCQPASVASERSSAVCT